MKTTFFLAMTSALAISTASSQAQTLNRSDLLKNPDIVWAGEGIFTYLLDERDLVQLNNTEYTATLGIDGRFGLMMMKDMVDRNDPNFQDMRKDASDLDLIYTLIRKDFLASSEVYADANLQTRYTAQQAQKIVTSIDTVETLEGNKIVIHELDPRDIVGYQVRQIVYFNKKTNAFGNILEAFAPLRELYNSIGKKTGMEPLFWLKINSLTAIPDLNSSSIFWARRTTRQIPFSQLTEIKNSNKVGDCVQSFLENIVKNYKIEELRDVIDMKKMPAETVKNILTSVDTIITFDPDTFTEVASVKTTKIEAKHIEKLRFITEWAWDKNKKMMGCYTVMMAPIIRRYDDAGNFLMEGPIFYKP